MDDVTLIEEHRQELEELGELVVYKGTPSSRPEILKRAQDAEILISGWTTYPMGIYKELPSLRMISLWSTGTDSVDLAAAELAGVKVTNVTGYAGNAVAELAFGLMLAVVRKIPQAHQDVRQTRSNHWQLFEGGELAGKTLGILGTGAIGAKAARIARGFDMKALAYDVRRNQGLEAEGLVDYVSFEEIFSRSDVVTVHMPLLPETTGAITGKVLESMPRHGVLINTARAGLVDQEALTRLLESAALAGAGLDDIDWELPSARRLARLDQVVLSPHMGFFTREAIKVKTRLCVESVLRFVKSRGSER
jgi:D-3-phosphoglycerate dehydrogenase